MTIERACRTGSSRNKLLNCGPEAPEETFSEVRPAGVQQLFEYVVSQGAPRTYAFTELTAIAESWGFPSDTVANLALAIAVEELAHPEYEIQFSDSGLAVRRRQ